MCGSRSWTQMIHSTHCIVVCCLVVGLQRIHRSIVKTEFHIHGNEKFRSTPVPPENTVPFLFPFLHKKFHLHFSFANFRFRFHITSLFPFFLQKTESFCYLLSTALDFPEEERMMQQSSVSISLSF